MKENYAPSADGTITMSTNDLIKIKAKKHNISKSLIQSSGGALGLSWIQKEPVSNIELSTSGCVLQTQHYPATEFHHSNHLMEVITNRMPVIRAEKLFKERFGTDMYISFNVKNIKQLVKKFPDHLQRIGVKSAERFGFKEVLVEPLRQRPVTVKNHHVAVIHQSESGVTFADVSNEDSPMNIDSNSIDYRYHGKRAGDEEDHDGEDTSLCSDQQEEDEKDDISYSSESSVDESSTDDSNNLEEKLMASLSLEEPHNSSSESSEEDIFNYFYQKEFENDGISLVDKNSVLLGETMLEQLSHRQRALDYGLLGRIIASNIIPRASAKGNMMKDTSSDATEPDHSMFLNVSQPFCLVCVGVQGSGKSHTMNTVLENCLIPCPVPPVQPITSLQQGMCGLVLHYDQSVNNVCEATGLRKVDAQIERHFRLNDQNVSGVKRMVILVSPTYYKQRKRFYSDQEFEIRPLLFKWSSLGAQQLKKLMRLSEKDTQLYVSVMLDLLRSYQRDQCIPVFEDFVKEVKKLCKVQGQSGPLDQRLQLLQSVIKESELNSSLVNEQVDLMDLMASGTLVIADLTDPLLSPDEANGIFQVLLEQFRNCHLPPGVGRVVAFDEAHKYLCGGHGGSEGGGKDGLSISIINTVRLMRHEGIRVLVSTQSPLALPHELLELVSVTVAHHFQSHDWYKFLSTKIPMPHDGFSTVKRLKVGEALVVCTKMAYSQDSTHDGDFPTTNDCESIQLQIRPRITANYGSSKTTK